MARAVIPTEGTMLRIAEALERLESTLRTMGRPPGPIGDWRPFNPSSRCAYCGAFSDHGGLPCPELAPKATNG